MRPATARYFRNSVTEAPTSFPSPTPPQISSLPAGRSPDGGRNGLLAALPEASRRALEFRMDYVALPVRRPLYEAGAPIRHVYFPVRGIVSVLYVSPSGTTSELAVVGNEGMVGMPGLLQSGASSSHHTAVLVAGAAYRLPAAHARTLLLGGGVFADVMLRYAHVLMQQFAQIAVCNAQHSLEQQLCRWLLLCLDRASGAQMGMTHQLIASMLGVRRQGVTEAARRLQSRGIIRYSRGHIEVQDPAALERCACECYGVLRQLTAATLDEDCARAAS